jgi:replicative DNA helicase
VTVQLLPVGPHPAADMLLVGAMLGSPQERGGVLALVHDDDLVTPALGTVLAEIRGMAERGRRITPQLVLDEVCRRGVKREVCTALLDATTCGAWPEACRDYAAAVLAAALRRQVESGGATLVSAAVEAAEADLPVIAATVAQRCADIAARLQQLRGCEL